MAVPYTFANQIGNIALSELDANFSNVSAFSTTAGTVDQPAQPAITSVGILTSVVATGNITSDAFFIGNGSQLTGVLAGTVSNGLSSITIPVTNGNVITTVGGYSIVIASPAGQAVTGIVSATGNVTGANVRTNGQITAGGNVTGGNIKTTGVVTATGTATVGNVVTTGQVSAVGNVSGNYFIGNGSQITGGYGNIEVAAFLPTYTGNVSGNYFIGNGSQLTDMYSNVDVAAYLPIYDGDIGGANIAVSGSINAVGDIVGQSGGYFSGTASGRDALYAGVSGFVPLATGVIAQFTGNSFGPPFSNFMQVNLQNITANGSADWITTASNGTDTTYFIDTGINGGAYVDADFFGDTSSINDGYLYVVGPGNYIGDENVGNLILGSADGVIKMFVGNTAQANVVQTISTSGISVVGNVTVSGDIAGANLTINTISSDDSTIVTVQDGLDVNGDISVTGSILGGFGTFRLSNLSTTQRSNLTPSNGDLIYNTTDNKIQGYENGVWVNLV